MKKLLLLVLIFFSLALGYLVANINLTGETGQKEPEFLAKKPILRLALVSDSHGDDELLAKALREAQGKGVNLVVGLGDWTKVGTLEELKSAKTVFDQSKLTYFLTSGDHDLWESRNRGADERENFKQIFGNPSREIEREGIQIIILDNSDIYKGIDANSWSWVTGVLAKPAKLRFVMAHKTPFHPESEHIMGENSPQVAKQTEKLLSIIEKSDVDGFFSGDLHFFAEFKSPRDTVKITTVGAVTRERNFQGPRFAIVTVLADYSWEVEDVEIR